VQRANVHHDVHAAKLRPHLDGHAKDDTLDNAGLYQGSETSLGNFTLKGEGLFDFLVFSEDLGVVDVTVTVKVGENLEGLLPPVLGREPSRRAREEEEADEENSTGNSLNTPWDPESRSALVGVVDSTIDERAAVLDEVLDQDTPSDGLYGVNVHLIDVLSIYVPIVAVRPHVLESPWERFLLGRQERWPSRYQ
jgi:hypothetical protein